jgi:hypothetical protein
MSDVTDSLRERMATFDYTSLAGKTPEQLLAELRAIPLHQSANTPGLPDVSAGGDSGRLIRAVHRRVAVMRANHSGLSDRADTPRPSAGADRLSAAVKRLLARRAS